MLHKFTNTYDNLKQTVTSVKQNTTINTLGLIEKQSTFSCTGFEPGIPRTQSQCVF